MLHAVMYTGVHRDEMDLLFHLYKKSTREEGLDVSLQEGKFCSTYTLVWYVQLLQIPPQSFSRSCSPGSP